MTTPAILYSSADELAAIDINTSNEKKHDSKFGSNADCSLDESAMVTVMEDSSMEYMLVACDTPQDISWQFLRPSDESKEEEEDFVLISEEDIKCSSSRWKSLGRYAYLAARKGGKWTSGIFAKTLPSLTGFHGRCSTIHECYDWVSDTNIEGGRLILPGQLISLDEHPALDRGISSSSTIMVSAHDLLSCQSSEQGRDKPPTSFTTLSLPIAMLELLKQRARIFANATGNALTLSTAAVSRQTGSLLSSLEHNTGIVASTAGWIYQTLELYFPASSLDDRSTRDCSSSCTDGETIELSPIAEKSQASDDNVD